MPILSDAAVPVGFNAAAVRAKLGHSGLDSSSSYRRDLTFGSPLMFGLVYLDRHLRVSTGEVSLCRMHLDSASLIRRTWRRKDLSPGESRDAVIAPRGSGKTTWPFLIGALWAMAHQHPAGQHIATFSGSGRQAQQHLKTLRTELETNLRLQADFPDLCRSVQNRVDCYEAANGAAITANGMDAETFGAKIGTSRPTCILLDDTEPDEKHYGDGMKETRLSQIMYKVLPMEIRAPVIWTATTTAFNGLAHDLVRSATGQRTPQWVRETGFKVHYYPAIEVVDGVEQSLWPQQWTLEYLQSIRKSRDFAMNYANMPTSASSVFWTPADIVTDPTARGLRRALVIDPAVSKGPKADDTGMAVVGQENGGTRRAVIDLAMGKQADFNELRSATRWVLRNERPRGPITRVKVERNQGGHVWLAALEPVIEEHPEVELELTWSDDSKEERFARFHDWYQRGWVAHSRELGALTDQELGYPGDHDDIMDAAEAGCALFLSGRK